MKEQTPYTPSYPPSDINDTPRAVYEELYQISNILLQLTERIKACEALLGL